ncbi:MAG: LCP family protein [Acidaminococcaceae bacterium]|nr:LCP family protein [Acidaminococcaceae bacterium]
MHLKSKKVAIVLAIIMGLSYIIYKYITGDFLGSNSIDNLSRSDRLNLKKNIVVMGVDKREGDVGRSDTLFVVMFDAKNNHASLLSIPRDTMVKIPQNGWDKINHAYAYGGHKMTSQTVEEFLGIRINNYVIIDFKGFVRIIDAIGGIDIDVEKNMHYTDPYDDDGLVINLNKGWQHLDGKKAIEYVRYRDEEGDIGRIKRQQKFIAAVYDKITSSKILLKVPGLIKEITSMIKTDMSLNDMVSLAKAMHTQMKAGGLTMATVPGDPAYIDDISYWIPDMTDLRAQMVTMQGATMSVKYRQAAERYENEYKRLLQAPTEEGKNDATGKKVKIIKKPTSKELQAAIKIAKETSEKQLGTKVENIDNVPEQETDAQKVVSKQPPKTEPATSNKSVRVQIINCSGHPEYTEKVANLTREAGFVVVGTGSGEIRADTQVVSSSSAGSTISKLASLPFRYVLRIVDNPNAGVEGTIYIGEDFN